VPIRCQIGHTIMMTSAEYGRMNVGRCIRKSEDLIGCSNNVLPLVDRWCSGRQECIIDVPTEELEAMNTQCIKILIKYLQVTYTCLKGQIRFLFAFQYNAIYIDMKQTVITVKL